MAPVGNLKPFDPVVDDIEIWIRAFKSFLLANSLDASPPKDATDTKQVAMNKKCCAVLLSMVGLPVVATLSSLVSPEVPEDLYLDTVLLHLESHYKPQPKAIAERFRFMGRRQQQGETVNQFLANLRRLASTCQFMKDLDTRLRDQFVFGLSSESAQKQLFREKDSIKLEDVIAIAVAQELSEQSLSVVRGSPSSPQQQNKDVNKVQQHRNNKGKSNQKSYSISQSSKQCPNCGSKSHTKSKDCPHKEVTCFNCGKVGHFKKWCRSKSTQKPQQQPSENKSIEIKTAEVKSASSTDKKKIWIPVTINGVAHTMELDTGCERSLLSEDFWKQGLGAPALTQSDLTFSTYTKQTFRAKGDLQCTLLYNDQCVDHSFPVTSGSSLFGRDLLHTFQVDWSAVSSQCNMVKQTVTLPSLLSKYSDIFCEPKGRIRNFKAKIILRDDAMPKFMKARPIPYAVKPKVDAELDSMEKMGVIEKIDHSDWASPLVVVPKPNGKVRITGDFKNTVNSQLHITQYPIANPESLYHEVSGCTKFSKLDGSNAYHQMEVEEECRKFLVINTHRGLYRYNVLPQGIASSPAIFQEFADKMLAGIPRSGTYIDDVLCGGKQDSEHLETLSTVFERMRQFNYYVSMDKCEFLKDNVEFLGHVLSYRGLHTSPRKIEAIEAIQPPATVTELKSFLGLVNFYCKFVPNFSDYCEPLYRLTKHEVKWQWSDECQSAFDRVKCELASSPILTHYDPNLPIGITCDAGPRGVGYVLFHRVKQDNKTIEQAISYASRILSQPEQNYSQIEKEALSIICALKKFYKFLCGRKFILVTDHKPLLGIFGPKSNLPSYAAARLHRWSVFMAQFDYTIEYRRTSEHGNADALSRIPSGPKVHVDDDDDDTEVNLIAAEGMEVLPVTSKSIRNSFQRDKPLSKVIQFLQSSWPSKNEDTEVSPYFLKREELTLQQGIVMWGVRVVIPEPLREKILASLHETHSGIVKMKSLARQHVWWPHIDKDIETMVKSCIYCCSNKADPPSAPLHPWQFPERPWQRLHVDLAGPMFGKMYLILVDSHSKWPEVYDLNTSTTSTSVISRLRDSFVRFGLPEQLVSDNGRQFVSAEFQQFCKNNGIRHITSSAYHPRTNGEAERFVQTFKNAMKNEGGDLTFRMQRFLFHYRATTHSSTGVSPSELLLGRKPRSLLDLVKPDVTANVSASQARQEKGYNMRVRPRLFVEGEEVWVKTFSKNQAKWSLGVVEKILGPVTYQVKVGDQTYKRHVDQMYAAMQFKLQHQFDPATTSSSPSPSPFRERCKSEPLSTPSSPGEDTKIVAPPSPVDAPPKTPSPPRYPQRSRIKPSRLGYQSN